MLEIRLAAVQAWLRQALVATIGTYLLTAAGTLRVLLFRSAPRRLMDALMGFAGRRHGCGVVLVFARARQSRPSGMFAATLGLLMGAAFFVSLTNVCRISTASLETRQWLRDRAWRGSNPLLMLAMTSVTFRRGWQWRQLQRWRFGLCHRPRHRHRSPKHSRRPRDCAPAAIWRDVAGTRIFLGAAVGGCRTGCGGHRRGAGSCFERVPSLRHGRGGRCDALCRRRGTDSRDGSQRNARCGDARLYRRLRGHDGAG